MHNIGAGYLDELRKGGHAVATDLDISACRCGDAVDRAARFVDAALTVPSGTRCGHAYIRLSCSRGLLFVEVTHLGLGTFDAIMADDAAMRHLEELRNSAQDTGHPLTIERGPRDQFRITTLLGSGAGSKFSSGCALQHDDKPFRDSVQAVDARNTATATSPP